MRKILLFIIVLVTVNNIYAQSAYMFFYSAEQEVQKANGKYVNVKQTKDRYFHFLIDEKTFSNGFIRVSDSRSYFKSNFANEYRVYSIELKDNGTYNYWTKDIASDGQTVLFLVNKNDINPYVIISRYSPVKGSSTVLKHIKYFIE